MASRSCAGPSVARDVAARDAAALRGAADAALAHRAAKATAVMTIITK